MWSGKNKTQTGVFEVAFSTLFAGFEILTENGRLYEVYYTMRFACTKIVYESTHIQMKT